MDVLIKEEVSRSSENEEEFEDDEEEEEESEEIAEFSQLAKRYSGIKKTTKKCTKCGLIFPNISDHLKHIRTNHLELCELCGEKFPLKKRGQHFARKHTKPAPCPECGLILQSADALSHHRNTVHTEHRFNCQFCDFQTKYSNSIRFHTARKHKKNLDGTPIALLLCTICGKEFRTTAQLKEHSTCHSNERSVACQFCGARFKTHSACYGHRKKMHKAEYEECKKNRAVK